MSVRPATLTSEQKAAVVDDRHAILLLAAAGSGKTEVLASRVERILAESAGEAFRILAVTYTVKAAEELRGRILQSARGEAWRVDCETIHGFALDWLLRYGEAVGIPSDVVVFADDSDRKALIRSYLQGLGIEAGRDSERILTGAIAAIDHHRTMKTAVGGLLAGTNLPLEEICDAYLGALADARGIDFPGMLTKFCELLESDPWVGDNFRRAYRHVLVDEGQDLTPAQAHLLRDLCQDKVSLFVVADERQSINNYAGGSFANAVSIAGENATVLRLHSNFRCAVEVLRAAERIGPQVNVNHSSLSIDGAPPGHVAFGRRHTPEDEAAAVEEWVGQLLSHGLDPLWISSGEDSQVRPEDVAVIARSRWLLGPVINALQSRGHVLSLNVDSSGFLSTSQGRLFFDALSLVTDINDRPARRRFLEELAVCATNCPESIGSLSDVFDSLRNSASAELLAMADHLKPSRGGQIDLDSLLGGLRERFASSTWLADVETVESIWRSYRTSSNAQQRSLRGFIRYATRASTAKPTDKGIRVLTIHRVKGLEFRAVAIVGVYEGALPDYRAKSSAERDGERRSLYVAMTRAKRALFISWPQQTIDSMGRPHLQQPSSFLIDAGLV